ncbi:MAG TPA: hypothetical protein VJT67_07745 [Longimicrobiaceae bacterium]|nr:hypothetical protein [Longimicrobiaceae bacterium]
MRRTETVVLSALFITLTACADSLTGVNQPEIPSRDQAMVPQARTPDVESAFTCRASTRNGELFGQQWRYSARAVRFSPDELASDGATILYRFKGYVNGADLVSWITCEIPATAAAVRRLDHGFAIPQALRARAGWGALAKGSPSGTAGMRAPRFDTVCDETGCHLDGLTVSACYYGGIYPNCNPNPSSLANMQCGALDPYCGGFGGSNDDSGWTTYGNGTAPEGDPQAFNQGPILWAGCVLAMAGSTLSVMDVLSAFQDWYSAYQNATGAYNLWQATIQNGASPETQQLYEYQYRQALQRQEDMKRAVSSATNISYLTLGGLALACGAAILAPTP